MATNSMLNWYLGTPMGTINQPKPVQQTPAQRYLTPTVSSIKGASTSLPDSTNTGGGKNVASTTNVSAPSAPSLEDQQRDAYFAELDRQSGLLPQTQSDLEGQVNNLFGSQSSSINTGLQGALGSLDLSKQNITSNKVDSLRGLDQDMRNQLQAGNIYLGARGAGDSSAANQYSYALSKVGSQNRAGIMKQANQLYSQVDQQINQAKATAQDQLQQLETWKNNNLLQISQYIQSLRGNIDAARANFIQERLAQLDAQVNTYKQAVAQWIMNKSTSLSQVQQQLQQLGVGPAVAFSNPGLPGMSFGGNVPSTGTQLFGQKKPDEYSGY